MEDYKIYIASKVIDIAPGTYEVVKTNETYDKSPTTATILADGNEVDVHVSKFNWSSLDTPVQFVWDDRILEALEQAKGYNEEQIKESLEGLRHCEFSVEEFIQEFGRGDALTALLVAIRTDFDAMPFSKKRMDKIYLDSIRKSMPRG